MTQNLVMKDSLKIKNLCINSKTHYMTSLIQLDCWKHKNAFAPKTNDKNGVNYVVTCTYCENVYNGETSKNAYTRGKQHLDEYNNKSGKSVMLDIVEKVTKNLKMRVKGQYRNDAMLRKIAEAVRINNCHIDNRINNKTE